MNSVADIPPTLSIRQPWVELILEGQKTIEVREWPIHHRGPLLLHAARALDWKTVELLGWEDALALPRGGVVAATEIVDAFEFTHESWLGLQPHHRVIHPPVRRPIYGARFGRVVPFGTLIPCRGRSALFRVPTAVEEPIRAELRQLKLMRVLEE